MKSKAAFSLVEALVVIAIISILAAVALPNFRKYAARARQANAKAELSSIFTAEQGFFATYRSYTKEWPVIGFVPEAMDLVVGANGYGVSLDRDRAYCSTPGGEFATVPKTLAQMRLVIPASTPLWTGDGYAAHSNNCPEVETPAACFSDDLALGNSAYVTRETFQASALGCPLISISGTTTGLDRWTIDESRNLLNRNSGL
jgi:type IV pilus assembly protein PilA